MREVDRGVYEVSSGEQVTMKFTPVEVGEEFVAVAVDGNVLHSPSGPTPTYSFDSSSQIGFRHVAMIECSFPGDTPNTARFEMVLEGSRGGSFQRVIKKSDVSHSPGFEFKVVAG